MHQVAILGAGFSGIGMNAMSGVVWTTGGCASYYVDAAGRNTTTWPHASTRFARELKTFDAREYSVLAEHRPA